MTETASTEAALPATTPEATPTPAVEALPHHLQFTNVRKRLLELEAIKQAGGTVDMKEVQTLVRSAADLMAKIQTSTTGPKKKIVDGEVTEKKAKAPPKAKKLSSIAHLAIPEGDDF